ncbi:unnamed protein product [Brassica oleracea var. botrytis]
MQALILQEKLVSYRCVDDKVSCFLIQFKAVNKESNLHYTCNFTCSLLVKMRMLCSKLLTLDCLCS